VGKVIPEDQKCVPGGTLDTPPPLIVACNVRAILLSSRLPAIRKSPFKLGAPHHGYFSEIDPSALRVRSFAKMTR
jgi:hypothetical protein